MSLPLRALVRFGIGLVTTAVVADAVVVYGLGNYDSTISREANFALDLALVCGLVLPIATTAFTLGSLVVSRQRDPWRGALACGGAVALLFLGAVVALPKSIAAGWVVAGVAVVSAGLGVVLHGWRTGDSRAR